MDVRWKLDKVEWMSNGCRMDVGRKSDDIGGNLDESGMDVGWKWDRHQMDIGWTSNESRMDW